MRRSKARFPGSLKDDDLLAYLKDGDGFRYLSRDARKKIQQLESLDPGSAEQRTLLMELWSLVLTDALRGLKRHDTREWKKDSGIDFDSFFNASSLGVAPHLEEVLEAFAGFERLAYGASPERYRDHVSHTFRVWIIGHVLLCDRLGGRLSVDAPRNLSVRIRTVEWQCMWAIAALCHDIGYPLSQIEEINKTARTALSAQGFHALEDLRFSFSPQMQPFYDSILRLMSSKIVRAPRPSWGYLTHLQNKYYLKFLKSFGLVRHGIISAMALARALVYFLESDLCQDSRSPLSAEDARQFLIRREILRAIASHTCPDIYHLTFNSLSFLLYIVDELQSWGRPTFEQMQYGSSGSGDDGVNIEEFRDKSIRIEVVASGEWEERKKRAKRQLQDIKDRLRLGVDTPKMKDLTLRFSILPKSKKDGVTLELRNGEIKMT